MRAGVAIVGSLSLDRVDGGRPRIGGCPYYGARALHALGVRALVAAKCAVADRPRLLPPLARLGVPVAWHDSSITAAFSFAYDGDRRDMVVDALADPWTPEEIRLEPGWWVHAAPLARSDFPPETLSTLARGRRLSLDGQGLVRPAKTGPLRLDPDYDPALLRSVSILKLAEEEAELLVDGLDDRGLASLGVPEIVVTLGSRGCIVFADGIAELVRTRRVRSADPTGAGDAFAAAYLVARSRGDAPTSAARRAAAVVSALLTGRTA